jgi:hypothetical protein
MAGRCAMDPLLPKSGGRKSKALPPAPPGISAIWPAIRTAEPRGAREAICRRRLPRGSRSKESFCCEYSEGRAGRTGIDRSQCVCRQRGCVRGAVDRGAVKLLSTQIVRKQAKALSSPTTRHLACNVVVDASQQYEWLASLATAKLERRRLILGLAHPPLLGNGANSLEIHEAPLLKSSASRQEKPPACNRNCAPPDEHFCHDVVLDRCTDVNSAWAKHFNSLLDHNGLTTGCESVTHKIGNGAA